MELYDFNLYNHKKRETMVWEHGNFICMREEQEFQVILYIMGKFFAEIWYYSPRTQIELVIGFKSQACLDPYLERVDLSEILP